MSTTQDPTGGSTYVKGNATLSTDGTFLADSDLLVASQKAVATFVAAYVADHGGGGGFSPPFDTSASQDLFSGLGQIATDDQNNPFFQGGGNLPSEGGIYSFNTSNYFPEMYFQGSIIFGQNPGSGQPAFINIANNAVVGIDEIGGGFIADPSNSGGYFGFTGGGGGPVIQTFGGEPITFQESDFSNLTVIFKNLDSAKNSESGHIYSWTGSATDLATYLGLGNKILFIE